MSIFVRLFLVYGLALTLGGALLLRDVQQQIRPGMKEVLEDTLADNAQALAAALAPALEHGDITNPAWQAQLRARLARPQDIHIHQHHKTANRQQLIITDSAGIVLFHSEAAETGKDYSRWNDILRTLRGEYGARSTQNTMYIAAPVHATDGRLLGVVSLGKPSADLIPYQQRTEHDLRQSGLLYLGATLALIALLTLWIRRSIDRVRRYATAHAPIPPAPRFHLASELNRLTAAIGDMRRELEDRAYITRYIETLTHELKSPLTAISASAELLQDDLPAADRARFADNIAQQSARLHRLVQRSGVAAIDDAELVVGDLVLNQDTREVTRGGEQINLTATQFDLLRYLMENAKRVVSKSQILDNVWNYDFGGQANIVELYISYLRKKIDVGREPMIHTVRGAGYVLRPAV